jgi:hypothetical protein
MNDGIRQATVIEPVMVPASAAAAIPSSAAGNTLQPQPRIATLTVDAASASTDAADDQHERHADRQHHQVRNLVGQGAEGVIGQEMAAQNREQRDHCQQGTGQSQIGTEAIKVATTFAGSHCSIHARSLGAASLSNASRFW